MIQKKVIFIFILLKILNFWELKNLFLLILKEKNLHIN